MNQELINLFEEILQKYYWAEDYVINQMSSDVFGDLDSLDEEIEEYKNKIRGLLK